MKVDITQLKRTSYKRLAAFFVAAFSVPIFVIVLQNQLETGLMPLPLWFVWISVCLVTAIRAGNSMSRLRKAVLTKDQSLD